MRAQSVRFNIAGEVCKKSKIKSSFNGLDGTFHQRILKSHYVTLWVKTKGNEVFFYEFVVNNVKFPPSWIERMADLVAITGLED